MQAKQYLCYIIGEDSFTLACITLLLKQDFIIRGICSNNHHLIDFATKHNISIYKSYADFEYAIINTDYDFLFSIANSKILSDIVLNRAKILSINFHNSLLPKYAGSHATFWCILNGESLHGVTWHEMCAQVDGGAIIKQGTIPIDANETAISLNMKCTELGLTLFNDLIFDLKNDCRNLMRQDKTLRSYFSKSTKPKGNALVDWNDDAANIVRLFRACNYIHHDNDFSVPKIIVNKIFDFILATQIEMTTTISTVSPGVVIKLSEEDITISTQSYDVVVSGLYSCDGNKMSIKDLQLEYNINVNTSLAFSNPSVGDALKIASELCASQEKFWIKDFSKANNPVIPYSEPIKTPRKCIYNKISEFNINPTIIKKIQTLIQTTQSQLTLALILVYLKKINNYEDFDIGLSKMPFFKPLEIKNLFFNFSWFKCDIDPESNFLQLLTQISVEIDKEKYNSNCLKDILVRYPSLQKNHIHPNIVIMLDQEDIHAVKSLVLLKINANRVSVYIDNSKATVIENKFHFFESMEKRIHVMLGELEENSSMPIFKLPLLNNNDNLYVSASENPEKIALPDEDMKLIFEKTVIENSRKIAVSHRSVHVSYEELNNQANNLATELMLRNIAPGEYVGVTSINSIETIIILLATLKVGAIYVPLDLNYPDSYLSHILNDIKPRIILSVSFPSEVFENFLAYHHPDIQFYSFSYSSNVGSIPNIKNEHLNRSAYIMYTSGSTGRPKGVIIAQQGIIRLVTNNNFLEIKSEYKIAQASNLSFDASTFEIWGALLNGATLVCFDKETVLDTIKFKNELKINLVDVLWVTASLLDKHVQNDSKIFSTVKYLLSGGDVVNANTVKKIFEDPHSEVKMFINGYGPTENTTFTTTYSIKSYNDIPDNIPIGKPIANTSIHVVDRYLQPVCIGVPGELLVSGVGLALGYISCEEKDKDCFIETAAITGKIQRYYKTGDYVKWLSNGNLAYLGRKDSQVKLRGFRVDLNSIKNVLLQHKKILQCHCVVFECTHLCVYIILKRGIFLEESVLLEYLKSILPYYMIPSEIIFVDQFPLTSNGKIDTLAMKKLMRKKYMRSMDKPLNDIQHSLLQLWQSLLKHGVISINDNFFEIGGDSLAMINLIYRVNKLFNAHIVVSEFLKKPTIVALSNLITGKTIALDATDSLLIDLNIEISKEDNNTSIMQFKTPSSTKAILVTGVTGFLGAHLANALTKQVNTKVYCFVRGDTLEEAHLKLTQSFHKWNIAPVTLKKLVIVHGDLSQPNLGLPKKNYEDLILEIDEIYHSAAQVNHLYNYEQLRKNNVTATINLLKLATYNRAIKFNYISTMSACFEHLDEDNRILESFLNKETLPRNIKDGYSLTKWVCEKILYKMSQDGFDIKIFRPAWISGETNNGIAPIKNNHLYLLLKACIDLGYAPNWDVKINITPVDILAENIIKCAKLKHPEMKVFNLINNHTVMWIDYIKATIDLGYKITMIESLEWYHKVTSAECIFFPLASIYTNADSRSWIANQDCISNAHNEHYSVAIHHNTIIDDALLSKYMKYAAIAWDRCHVG